MMTWCVLRPSNVYHFRKSSGSATFRSSLSRRVAFAPRVGACRQCACSRVDHDAVEHAEPPLLIEETVPFGGEPRPRLLRKPLFQTEIRTWEIGDRVAEILKDEPRRLYRLVRIHAVVERAEGDLHDRLGNGPTACRS